MATAQQLNSQNQEAVKAKINKKVDKALRLLNEAGSEQIQYTSHTISDRWTQAKEQATKMKDNLKENVSGIIKNENSDQATQNHILSQNEFPLSEFCLKHLAQIYLNYLRSVKICLQIFIDPA